MPGLGICPCYRTRASCRPPNGAEPLGSERRAWLLTRFRVYLSCGNLLEVCVYARPDGSHGE